MKKSNIIAIIPARSGSKSIKDKNIRFIGDKPMLAYSIMQAKQSKYIDRVIVSTDSEVYKQIAEQYGAEVPFRRPADISCDSSLDIEVFRHALEWLRDNEGYEPELCVHLRVTHPIRDPQDIDKMIELLLSDKDADSIRSISPASEVPYKMWFCDDSNTLSPIITCDGVAEAYNAPRQRLPKVYMQNACIDITRASTVLKYNSMTGRKILGYKMDYIFDIDTEDDFLKAEQAMLLMGSKKNDRKLVFVFDIDGIIASKTPCNDYSRAKPLIENIVVINQLYDAGHKVVLFTARGYATGKNWESVTFNQMQEWGVKYHELKYGKPAADVYVDDKFIEISKIKSLL